MLKRIIVRTVEYCTLHPWAVVAIWLLAAVAAGAYAGAHFAITTDIEKLISPELEWRQREIAFEKAFPGRYDSILVVVDAPTQELVSQATEVLADRLAEDQTHFRFVQEAGGGEFFRRNGILFATTEQVEQLAQGLGRAEPLIAQLAGDPSLRGVADALSLSLAGIQRGMIKLDAMVRPLTMGADTIEAVLASKPASFSWHAMLNGKPPEPGDLRKFIDVRPVLDFSALEPGREASDAIRKAAADLDIASAYQARVRLTGPIAIADEEFATIQEGALVNGIGTVVIVLVILWLALRSGRLIFAVYMNMFVGLAITAALGLMMVGALNLISIAFAVLFVGLGVDFGIQFAVRYRAERYRLGDLREALVATAAEIGAPLTLAAGAVAAGFLSFLPTAYRGVSELGQIAGAGMLIAFVTSVTLLPALLTFLSPAGEPEEIGYRALAPVDRFMERHRIGVIVGTAVVVLAGLPLLFYLRFDFNPINLRSPKVESVATFLELRSDPNIGANAINVVAPSVDEAGKVAERLGKIPEVGKTVGPNDFIPQDQDRKLAALRGLAKELATALKPESPGEAPTDEETVEALEAAAGALRKAAGEAKGGPGADAANRLADDLTRLAKADKGVRERADAAFVPPLKTVLEELRNYLKAETVTLDNLPDALKREWVSADGRARVEALPKGDPNDNETIRSFARAVRAGFPGAVGGPISILESGDTIVKAFIQAGIWALLSIAILLWIVLKRVGDVLLTLIPLLVAGVLTLEVCVLIGMPLNFANIIALPLLLGVGVAFKIYYIMAWRAGQTDLLQSSLTRAVIWSALTTATAFGSLWLSSHPGTSSMGKLLAISLVCTLAAAVLFQPALMGRPRTVGDE